MPNVQGKLPRVVIPGHMVGYDTNGNTTNDSVVYRGRPMTHMDAIDFAALNAQNEGTKQSWQMGQRVIGLYLTTGQIIPPH